jgi:hypothetical protein
LERMRGGGGDRETRGGGGETLIASVRIQLCSFEGTESSSCTGKQHHQCSTRSILCDRSLRGNGFADGCLVPSPIAEVTRPSAARPFCLSGV